VAIDRKTIGDAAAQKEPYQTNARLHPGYEADPQIALDDM